MSNVKRYFLAEFIDDYGNESSEMAYSEKGDYVKYTDYQSLQEENDQLIKELINEKVNLDMAKHYFESIEESLLDGLDDCALKTVKEYLERAEK